MIRRCCCAGSTFPPCCWNSWFGSATYRFTIPFLSPLQYGRPDIASACDSTESAWTAPSCSYTNQLWLYNEKLLNCDLPYPDCYNTAGPWTGGIGPSTITVGATGNRNFIPVSSDLGCAGAGTGNYRYYDAYATATYDVGFGTDWYRYIDVLVYKCANIGGVEYPRSVVTITAHFQGRATLTVCPGTSRPINALSSYVAVYVGDPFTFSQQLSPRVWLKSVRHIDGRWCTTGTDRWEIDSLSTGMGLSPSAHPTNFPEYIDIARIS